MNTAIPSWEDFPSRVARTLLPHETSTMAHFCHADWREDHTASWKVIHLHEILKIVGDLKGQGQVDLAQTVAGQHIDRLGSADLRFDHLVLTARLGNADRVMDLLEEFLVAER